jgi:hypothetical protein
VGRRNREESRMTTLVLTPLHIAEMKEAA